MAKQKYYVVWKGRKPGVYTSWAACEAQVKGFTGAEYKSFPTREMAEAAFRNQYEDYMGKNSSSQQWLFAPIKPVIPSICVDAACSGSPGPVEYQGVLLENGQQVFRRGPMRDGTNNIGEFLAIVHALSWMMEKNLDWPVYSDSETALGWVRAGRCNTKLKQTASNTELFALVKQAEHWLTENRFPNKLLKWDTHAWGEIPADFGRK
ncbi:MAG: ribonuclease H family protein [Anaerolineales bacterium]